jgi:hypothetical protein
MASRGKGKVFLCSASICGLIPQFVFFKRLPLFAEETRLFVLSYSLHFDDGNVNMFISSLYFSERNQYLKSHQK